MYRSRSNGSMNLRRPSSGAFAGLKNAEINTTGTPPRYQDTVRISGCFLIAAGFAAGNRNYRNLNGKTLQKRFKDLRRD